MPAELSYSTEGFSSTVFILQYHVLLVPSVFFCSQNTVTQTCHSICSKWHFFSFLPSRLLKPPRGNDNSQIISVSLLSASFGSVDPIPIPSQSFLTSATVKIRNLTWMTSSFQAVASTKAYRFTKSHKKPQLCIILPRFF